MNSKIFKIKRLSYIFVGLFLFVSSIYAETPQEYPVKNIDGKLYYEYTVLQGDGLYGIARRFGIKQSDLHEANPDLDTNIKIGDIILIPVKQEEQTPKAVHVVQPKQTLYGISKIYGIPVDSLIALNPESANGIRVGETLILSYSDNIEPQNASDRSKTKRQEENLPGTHVVKRKETLYSISIQYGVPIHELIENNPELKDGLKFGTTIVIFPDKVNDKIVYQPAEQETEPQIITSVNYNLLNDSSLTTMAQIEAEPVMALPFGKADNVVSNANMVKIALFLPFMIEDNEVRKSSLKFVEFYRGILIALEDMKKAGISVEINVFDTQRSLEVLDSLLALDALADVDIIIGPAYTNHLQPVLDFAKKHDIIAVVPFSSKIPEEYFYPKLIQFNPSQEFFYKQAAAAYVKLYPDKFLIGRFPVADIKGDMFADELRSQLELNQLPYTEFMVTEQNIDSIVASVGDTKATLLLASASPIDVNPVLEKISTCKAPYLSILGFEEWQSLISRCKNTYCFSRFAPKPTHSYVMSYEKWFGELKQIEYERYDLMGYDVVTLAVSNVIDNDLELKTSNPYQQSTPVIELIDNRQLNVNFYLFRYNGLAYELIDK